MCGYALCTEEFEAYTSHLMGCRSCFAPNRHFCQQGLTMKLETDARFVCSLGSLEDRRRWMARFKVEIPAHIERLESIVKRMYGERSGVNR